ncbi:hypothetical protein R1flu_019181 [Riccia fluitans]|uniref:Uncharacterized protein n=1 Tax=Riccia fluitans TaxID=41844 RepID=A0ABD1ZHY9_9MARC
MSDVHNGLVRVSSSAAASAPLTVSSISQIPPSTRTKKSAVIGGFGKTSSSQYVFCFPKARIRPDAASSSPECRKQPSVTRRK